MTKSRDNADQINGEFWAGNGIYNGKMTISQRGDFTSPTAATNGIYYLDRWKQIIGGGITATITQISAGQPDGLKGKSIKLIATSTATANIRNKQAVEDYEYYAGKIVTISAKVKSNSANARLDLYDGSSFLGGDTSHTGGGDWETLSVTTTFTLAATLLEVHCGIDGVDSANVPITSGDYMEFTDVRLDLGSHRLSGDREYGEELALCQRYAFAITGASKAIGSGQCISTTQAVVQYQLPVEMRTEPTLIVSAANHFKVANAAGSGITSTAIAIHSNSSEGVAVVTMTVPSGLVAGNGANAYAIASGQLLLTAEL